MGKGDIKSKKGKTINGTFGVNRKARKQNKITVNLAAAAAPAAPAKKASKKKA
jgi:ribosomal small subunit protein bTHX